MICFSKPRLDEIEGIEKLWSRSMRHFQVMRAWARIPGKANFCCCYLTLCRPGVSVRRSAYNGSRLCLQLVGRSTMGQRRQKRQKQFVFAISNGRFPHKYGSDRCKILVKRISGHLQFLIFRRWICFPKFWGQFFFLMVLWRTYEFLSVTGGRFLVKSYCL